MSNRAIFMPIFIGKDDTMAKAKYTKGKDGYYKTNVWDGTYTESGKKHLISLRSKKSSKDLEEKVIEHNRKIKEREFVRQSDSTFLDYARAWKKAYKSHLEHNTNEMYTNIIEKHFTSLNVPVSAITRAHYITAFNNISGKRTKQQFQMIFKQVLKSTIHDKLLPASALDEILADTIKVKYKPQPKRALTEAEKEAIKKCKFKDDRDKVFLYLLYYTGMRGEEIRALTKFDFNFTRKEISVSKAVTFDKNEPLLKDTKNNKHRIIPMSDALISVCEPYLATLKHTNLFFMDDGYYLTKSAYRRMWERVLKEIQNNSKEPIFGLTPHIFRHNYCSSLCNKIPEISITKIAEILGDSEKMVIEVYNHELSNKEKPHEVIASALAL